MEEKKKKKQITKISVFITSIFVIFMSVTYAFITQVLTGTKEVVINAGVLDLVLEEENAITISDALPMYDEVGIIQEDVFIFSLVNNTSISTDYTLRLKKVSTTNELSEDDVKYYLTKEGIGEPALLSALTDGVVDKGTISGNDTIDYTLRLWIDSSVTSNEVISGKSLSYRIEVEASQSQSYQVRYGELYSATMDGMQAGIIFNEDGSALMYNNYVQQEQFEAGTFTFTGENITSSIDMNFKISEDGTELYLEVDNEEITLNLIEKGGDILFGKNYFITVDGVTASITFNEDGSLFMNNPNSSETIPAGTVYYKDNLIYESESNELMGYTMDNGNIINFQGMLLKLQTFGTIKIHDDEYILDEYQEYDTGLNTRVYNITNNIYTKEDLLDSYMVFQSESKGLVDALYLSSDFIDSSTKNGTIVPPSVFFASMAFVQSGYVFSDTSLGTEITLGEGLHFIDIANALDNGFSPFNVIISRNIENPILMEAVHTSETESYDMDLTDTESLLWFISDEYIDAEMIVGSTIVYNTDGGDNLVRAEENHITQISENVYSLATGTNDFYTRYFVKEDTYLDTNNDGINDKYYKKGIYVDTNRPWSTQMKIVKYHP